MRSSDAARHPLEGKIVRRAVDCVQEDRAAGDLLRLETDRANTARLAGTPMESGHALSARKALITDD